MKPVMKILLIHTYYQIRGGEDQVFEQEKQLLERDHEVRCVSFRNASGIKGLWQFIQLRDNHDSDKIVENNILTFRPDIVHIHNLHFAGGWGILRIVKEHRIPMVMTLHNYRLLCPSGTLFYDHQVYLDSLSASFPWDAVRKKVYKNSMLLTFWLARTLSHLREKKLLNLVDRYIVLTEFAKDLFSEANLGIDQHKFEVKPNFVDSAEGDVATHRGEHFLFVGRLSAEKGVGVVLEAFAGSPYSIRIAGTGDLTAQVEEYQRKYPRNFRYLGVLDPAEILEEMRTTSALVFPSLWYEGLPMTVVEAFSVGTPIIASRIGALSTLIHDGFNGLHFHVGDAEDLLRKVQQWRCMGEAEQGALRQNAFRSYLDQHTPERNRRMLINIYNQAVAEARSMHEMSH